MIAIISTITLLCTAVYLWVLCYMTVGWWRLKLPSAQKLAPVTKVSVVIAARNEEEKIELTIKDILAQEYPEGMFELIIADDHSTDRTAEIVKRYAGRGVKLIELKDSPVFNSYKKRAISECISFASGELIIATDADCRMGSKWMESIVNFYQSNNLVMISSPVTYFEEKNLFERMQTLEFSYLIGIGASFIGNKKASTCNGANLAYSRKVFYEVGGFAGIDDLASGDDELLLHKVTVKYPNGIGFLKSAEAIVYTHAKQTLSEFLQQRRRWASKSTRYKDSKVVAFVVSIWVFNFSILINALLGFYDVYFWKLLLLQFALKYLFETAYLLPVNIFFKRPKLVFLLSIISPVHVLYFVYVGIIGNTKKYQWKGRMVR